MSLRSTRIILHSALGGPEELVLRELRREPNDMVVLELGRFGEARIPAGNLDYLAQELSGVVTGPRAGIREIDAVLNNDALLLGKGHDGLVYRVGERVVKVAATVPFQPTNPGHRRPHEANKRLRRAVKLGEELHRAGLPGIAQGEFVEHAGRAFWIRDYYELPKRLTRGELHRSQEIVLGMHDQGVTLNDRIQIGRSVSGPILFDLGAATRACGPTFEHRREDDILELRMFYEEHGARFYLRRGSRAERQLDFLLRHGYRMTAGELAPVLRGFMRQVHREVGGANEQSLDFIRRTRHLQTRARSFSEQDRAAVLLRVQQHCQAGRPAKVRSLPRQLVAEAVKRGELRVLDPAFRYVLPTPDGVRAAMALAHSAERARQGEVGRTATRSL